MMMSTGGYFAGDTLPQPSLTVVRFDGRCGSQSAVSARGGAPPGQFGIGPVGGDPAFTDNPDPPPFLVPPLFIFCAAFIAGWWLDRVTNFPTPPNLPGLRFGVGVSLGVLAAAVEVAGIWEFGAARSWRLLKRPAARTATRGIYRFSRNPMCLGLAGMYAALAMVLNQPLDIIALVPALAVVDLAIIRREERYLTARFGATYTRYCRRVRRWI